jgi:hypothetical protein
VVLGSFSFCWCLGLATLCGPFLVTGPSPPLPFPFPLPFPLFSFVVQCQPLLPLLLLLLRPLLLHLLSFINKPHVIKSVISVLLGLQNSVGQTVKHVGLDLRSSVFSHGQFYVGVSRVTSVANIKAIWPLEQQEARTKNIVYSELLLQ